MKKIKKIAFLTTLFHCLIFCNSKYENIAFCLESKGKVFRDGFARKGNIFKGDVIYNGDKITVGVNGFLSFLNIHERSEIKIFENSSIKVQASINRANGKKELEVAILGGRIIVDKKEINNNRLIVISPSSNAFLKNSHFLISCIEKSFFDESSYCVFTSIKGNILVENAKSKKLIFLKNGDTIISTPKGDFFQIETFRDDENLKSTLDMEPISFQNEG